MFRRLRATEAGNGSGGGGGGAVPLAVSSGRSRGGTGLDCC